MKRLIFFFLLILVSFTSLKGQSNWREKFKKDLVTIDDGKYHIEEYALITTNDDSYQIKLSAIAPTDLMSRDNFVSFYSTYGTVLILKMFEDYSQDKDFDIKQLDELIGEPDISISFILTNSGLQVKIETDDKVTRQTITWDDYFSNY